MSHSAAQADASRVHSGTVFHPSPLKPRYFLHNHLFRWSYRHFPRLSAALAGCCLWISQQGMLWHTPVWDCGHGHRGLGSQVGGSSWRDGVMQGDNDLLGEEVLSTPVSPGPSSSHSQLSLSPPMAQVISVGLGLEMHATLCPLVCSAWLGYRQC